MEYCTYILQSQKDGKRYIGSSKDIYKRLEAHNLGLTKSTKCRRPFQIIFIKEFETRAEAVRYEKFLKSLKGGPKLHKVIQEENQMPL